MKFQLFALFLVIAGTYAKPSISDVVIAETPKQVDERFIIEGQIRNIIQQIRQNIRNAGLDPLDIKRIDYEDAPVPLLVEIKAFIEDLKFTGLSNIAIHNLNYNLLFNTLRFDLSLPALRLSIGDSGIEASVFDNFIEGQLQGSLAILRLRLAGEVRVNMGIIGGISLRSISLNFTLGSIESNISVSANEIDHSDFINTLLGQSIPQFILNNRAAINRFLENTVRDLFNRSLLY